MDTTAFASFLACISERAPRPDWRRQVHGWEESGQGFVLVTFDDGYADIYSEAMPLLESYRMPCVIFVTAGFIDRTIEPYEDRLGELVNSLSTLQTPDHGTLQLRSGEDREAAFRKLHGTLKKRSLKSRRRYMYTLSDMNVTAAHHPPPPFLTWAQIRELDRHPLVTIGAHGVSHVPLTRPAPWEVHRELVLSRRRLEEELNRPVDMLAYPYGASSALTRGLARLAGYQLGFTTEQSRVRLRRDPMYIPRIEMNAFLRSACREAKD
jgi:peptidoglycan/xylan/chitin deacetylase (PgdA/CDA1 family)